jgi:hypothetical protein
MFIYIFGNLVTGAGGSPNHVTRELLWDISMLTGESCKEKAIGEAASKRIPCTPTTAPIVCDPTSRCLRLQLEPFKVCFKAEHKVPSTTNVALYESVYGRLPFKHSCSVCFTLRVASLPFFIEKVEIGAEVGSTHPQEMIPLAVNKSVTIELVAADNLGEKAIIYLLENPGAPSGSSMTEAKKLSYNGQQFQGDAYSRLFHFTPKLEQGGTVSEVCFVVENEKNMKSSKRCYILDVRFAVVQWESRKYQRTPGDSAGDAEGPDVHKNATIGCEMQFEIKTSSHLYSMQLAIQNIPVCSTCVIGGIELQHCNAPGVGRGGNGVVEAACCGNGKCDGVELGSTCPQDCPPDDLTLKQTQIGDASNSFISKALLRWRPMRGMEGRTLLMCVEAVPINQGGKQSIIARRTPSNAPSLCYLFTVLCVCMMRVSTYVCVI